MKCHDIDAIIDDHRIGALCAAERAAVHAHLHNCRRCTAAWLTNEALLGEALGSAPPELLAATVRYAEASAAVEPASAVMRWPAWAGLAALLLIAALFALVVPSGTELEPRAGAVASTLVEDRDYRRLPAAASAAARDAHRVQVVQLFAYDCGPCYAFEPAWAEWTARHRDDIELVRVPVQWNERAERYARAHYAAEALGKAAEIRPELFEDLHARDNPLDSYEALAELFARFGVERAAFDDAYASPGVERAVTQARALVERYGVTGVPSLVIGGELVTTAAMTGSPTRLVDVVERLVRCVREQPAAAGGIRHC